MPSALTTKTGVPWMPSTHSITIDTGSPSASPQHDARPSRRRSRRIGMVTTDPPGRPREQPRRGRPVSGRPVSRPPTAPCPPTPAARPEPVRHQSEPYRSVDGSARDHDRHLAAERIRLRASAGRPASPAGPPRGASSARGTRRPPIGPHASARSRKGRRGPSGASNSTVARSSARSPPAAPGARRPARQEPSNAQRGAGMPLATSAASTADAPGMGTTGRPVARPRRHQPLPRVAHQRRARVGHERHVLARLQARDQLAPSRRRALCAW